MVVDGRALAAKILARAKARASGLARPPKVVALQGSDTPATRSYLAIKERRAADAGCLFEVRSLGASVDDADAVIVQLPLLGGADQKGACDSIPLGKDADVLSTEARMKFEADEPDALVPPVAKAVAEIFSAHSINPAGKEAVVIGQGWLVGKPCATWLSHAGADVFHASFRSGDFSALKDADIVVSGVGAPHFIKPEMLKEGVVLIDAGTSESSGVPAGDADPTCAAKCSLFTPVPGGVGPAAVACLFANAVTLAERANSSILSP